ncbi:MAG: 1,4-alpha-glucan branching protein GlgB [Pseudomonadota bacterium]
MITDEQIDSLVSGTCADPFAVLGRHKNKGKTWVTVFDPGAAAASVVGDGDAVALRDVRPGSGVFSGPVPALTGPYSVEFSAADGTTWQQKDPYGFGPILGELDEYLIGEGTHTRIWKALGARVVQHEGSVGTRFAVWAPNARRVSVVGAFNQWDGRRHPMRQRGGTGVWEIFLPDVGEGSPYKYEILPRDGGPLPLKADPVGFGAEHPPSTASIVRDISGYGWKDADWMAGRAASQERSAPISVYEVHLGSWRRRMDQGGRPLSYKEAALELVSYVAEMGFTHIEFLPLSEFPFDGSWGYQPIGLYAPTIRHGPPHEFRDFVEAAHLAGLGVLLDWVPGHFPTDAHGLGRFDGTALYEHDDPREGFHQDWNTLIYNYGRSEVANFLIANALYWLEEYHLDGLRVDAVASMLYRDYSRNDGQWIPNKDGGRENYEAIALLQRMNQLTYGTVPGIMTVAEESTAFPGVSAPVDHGGLGFGYKWNMGWMNDTLDYISKDPIYRRHHHHQMTFGLHYAFSENFILPISHDEVVHGKGSMLQRMPGNHWERFANLRAYYGFMWGHPGKKLLFMGCEFAQGHEWQHDTQLDWDIAGLPPHAGVSAWVRDLNWLYRRTPSLFEKDCMHDGFQWIEANDAEASVYAWLRLGKNGAPPVAVICNFTPVLRSDYRLGLPCSGRWREALNSDSAKYGGGDRGNLGSIEADGPASHGQPVSAQVTLPPLSAIFLVFDG